MKDISTSNFGLLIAYLLPGFVVVWGLSGLWPVDPVCVGDAAACSSIASLVGFLNSAVGALAAGMTVSAIRFVLIDTLHHRTGLTRPALDGDALQSNLAAVGVLVDQHYRYYQFHANLLVAGVFAYAAHLYQGHAIDGSLQLLLGLLAIAFWLAARDNLKKYYQHLKTFSPKNRTHAMSNGMHPKPAPVNTPTPVKPPQPAAASDRDKAKPAAPKPADTSDTPKR